MIPDMPQDRTVSVGRTRIRYWDVGSGDPVLLIHGLGASAEIWLKNVPALARDFRVLVPDLVGFGQSDKPDVAYSPEFLVRFLADFMEVLEIDTVHLAGHSLGGGLALDFAFTFPRRVRSLALIDSAGFGRDITWTLRLVTVPVLGEILTIPTKWSVQYFFEKAVADPGSVPEDFIDLYWGYARAPGARRAFLTVLRSLCTVRGARKDLLDTVHARLSSLTVPVLIIWGRDDRLLPVHHADAARSLLPGADIIILDRCGHMPQFECPLVCNERMKQLFQSEVDT